MQKLTRPKTSKPISN